MPADSSPSDPRGPDSPPPDTSTSDAATPDATNSDPTGRFGRVVDLYGPEGFARIRGARVAVVGLGGVGSHAAVALARSGLGELLLVDFDLVTASSLNRSPVADPTDVGRPKVTVLAEHLARTCPDTAVTEHREFCHEETLPGLLQPGSTAAPDLVVDAIDSRNPKVTLLAFCLREGLPVIASMGAAARRDPAAVRIGDLSASRICPLARHVRKFLKRRGFAAGIPCVWSEEVPASPREPDLGDRTCERGRVRNRLPSQMSLPGIFGYALATMALDRLVGAGT